MNFLASIPTPASDSGQTINKLALLTNYVEPEVFDYISEETEYDKALAILDKLYLKPTNEIYARHILASRKQDSTESLDSYLQVLKELAKSCKFKLPENVKLYEEEYIRDAFISGLSSTHIRERLLEEMSLTLAEAFEKARAIEVAQKHSKSYQTDFSQMNVNALRSPHRSSESILSESSSGTSLPTSPESQRSEKSFGFSNLNAALPQKKGMCMFCGNARHDRSVCPARNVTCHKCGKPGHFQKVCKSDRKSPSSAAVFSPCLSGIIAGSPASLNKAVVNGMLNHTLQVHCLISVRPYV